MVSAQLDLTEARVLDLFSGSGALGLEAMSRGATHLDFVEKDRIALSFARDNAKSLDADLAVNFHQTDVFMWIKSQPVAQYQLILADPRSPNSKSLLIKGTSVAPLATAAALIAAGMKGLLIETPFVPLP